MVGRGVRVGAAAFVAGLSLAGPQALGVAGADGPETGSSSVSAGSGDSAVSAGPADLRGGGGEAARLGRSAADRAGRVSAGRTPVSAAEAMGRSVRMSVSVDAVEDFRPGRFGTDPVPAASAVVGPWDGADRLSEDVIVDGVAGEPVVSEVGLEVPVPLAVSDLVDAPAEVSPVMVSDPAPSGQSVVSSQSPVATVGFAVSHLIDTVGTWLSGFPANPIADVVSAGLWLVRRTLFPVGADVGLWGSAACVTTGDCSERDLTGANLVGKDLSAVNFAGAVLVRSNLAGANLATADLTGANLTGANLTGANLVGAPPGSGSGAWNNGVGTDDFWYRTLVADTAGLGIPAPRSWPAMRGTPGAPLIGTTSWLDTQQFGEPRYPDDGVQGIIYNQSDETIAVRTVGRFKNTYDGRSGEDKTEIHVVQTAILYPGDAVSYQLFSSGAAVSEGSYFINYLRFYPTGVTRRGEVYVFGAAVGLGIVDPTLGYPSTYFVPPGEREPRNVREGWREGEEHHEIWGSIDIGVKREGDGWQINASPEYLARYPNPSNEDTSDWAIFTVNVYSL